MATWTQPERTWNVGEIATSGHLNTYLRDNTQYLYDELVSTDGGKVSVVTAGSIRGTGSIAWNPGTSGYVAIPGLDFSITALGPGHDILIVVATVQCGVAAGGGILLKWDQDGTLLENHNGEMVQAGGGLATVTVPYLGVNFPPGAHDISLWAAGSDPADAIETPHTSWISYVQLGRY